MNELETTFAKFTFRGRLRPTQEKVVAVARRKLADGKRRLHIVAPPGSGKTVLGLYLWTECVRRPVLVLSPNSAIQAQWVARTDLFDIAAERDGLFSTDPRLPGLLTSLTYQSVTLPARGDVDLDEQAVKLWLERLIESGQAKDPDEADVWIADLKRHNHRFYDERLGWYRKDIRDAAAKGGQALELLHGSSRETLERLRDCQVGLIILDECHHLMGHWGRVLADAHDFLEEPIVVGLTATPPDRSGKSPDDIERYDSFFGPIDFEVPVPAVVKDGFLAPYQDLAYFVRPTTDELRFVASADDQLHQLVEDLCRPLEPSPPDQTEPPTQPLEPGADPAGSGSGEALPDWLSRVLRERRLPTGTVKDWKSFEKRDPEFATAARLFLRHRGEPWPAGVPQPHLRIEPDDIPEMAVLVPVLDRYVRHRLRRSAEPADHQRAEGVVRRLRMLGVQITERGAQACASPVGRVMAYSQSKCAALLPILKAELSHLGSAMRAVVVADYEKTSAVTAEVDHLLDSEAGGAMAAFKTLLGDPLTDSLDPVLVTGSSVLVDDDLAGKLVDAAQSWLAERRFRVALRLDAAVGFHVLNGQGADWCPRVYVSLITDLFQQGLTRCLVGTRGLLGEGWDANKVNVLVDLTTVTTSMTVNQLRGRSMRVDPEDPSKLADNWDVVCIAPEFSKGLDDYSRFIRKHKTIYGVTDDGAIEKGVGHVHAALTELKPEGLEGSLAPLNAEMLGRVARRAAVRELWKIGQPYTARPVSAVEVCPIDERHAGGLPPFAGAKTPWSAHSLTQAISQAVLGALAESGLIPPAAELRVGDRAGGYVRVFLEQADPRQSRLFTGALQEVFAPLEKPRYVVPRHVDRVEETWLSRLLPTILGRYLRRRKRKLILLHAVPSMLARNKRLVAVYERYWNAYVSPGKAVYAHRGAGERMIERARRDGQIPRGQVHAKDIFL